jgi:glycosyltransferase involved in cell wall biosynthesis
MLESACAMKLPPGLAWEVLIIDNGRGGRENEEAAMAFAGRLPVRVVRETAIGLCPARNRAALEARGRYVCWTDDDTLLDPFWLAAYAEAFARHPEAVLFGGRILPWPEPPAPAWFERFLHDWPISYAVAYRDMGDEEMPIALEGGRIPWGANFAVRADVQRAHLYNVELGLSSSHRRSGDETDMIYRIIKAGGAGWWVPGASVRHIIPAERQTRRYIAHYYDQGGRTAAFLHDRFPGDNVLAGYGPPIFARMGNPALRAAATGARLISAAADLAGMTGVGLRFLARSAFWRGYAAHAREPAATPRPAPRLTEAGKAC